MYIKNACMIHDKIEIEKHYPGNFGAAGVKRMPKKKKTPEEMKKQNLWRRERDLRRLIEHNFHTDGVHVTLKCKKEDRPTLEEGRIIIRQFRDKLRKAYRQQGWELKYIITTETGKRGAVHWHCIINYCSNEETSTSRMIREIWTRGRPCFVMMDESGDYKTLAEYIIKESSRRIEEGKTEEKLSYMSSRNLIKPPVKKEKIKAKRWSREPAAPTGYYVVKDSVINGINKFTGLPYQYYTIRKLKKESGG